MFASKKTSIFTRIAFSIIAILFGCGEKKSGEAETPTTKVAAVPTATPSTVSTTEPVTTVIPETTKNFWIAHSDSYILESYSEIGVLIKTCTLTDTPFLAALTTGGISSLAFFDAKTILALLDPGTAGEQIVSIDISKEVCTVSQLYEPNDNFKNIISNAIVPHVYSDRDYARIFVAREDGIDRFTWGNTSDLATRAGLDSTPFLPTTTIATPSCIVGDKIISILSLGENDNKTLLLLTTGATTQGLNLIGSLLGGTTGNPQCLSNLDYNIAGQPTTNADIPIQAIVSDNKIYVLYQNPTDGAKLVRYNFNGTQLSSPYLLSQDPDDLGFTPTAMTFLSNNNIVVANGRSLAIIDAISGRLIRPLGNSKFNNKVSAMVSEP